MLARPWQRAPMQALAWSPPTSQTLVLNYALTLSTTSSGRQELGLLSAAHRCQVQYVGAVFEAAIVLLQPASTSFYISAASAVYRVQALIANVLQERILRCRVRSP